VVLTLLEEGVGEAMLRNDVGRTKAGGMEKVEVKGEAASQDGSGRRPSAPPHVVKERRSYPSLSVPKQC
jgi:hypothetical protein